MIPPAPVWSVNFLALFSGQHPSTIDDKNRIIIPAKMRQAAGEAGEKGFFVTRGIDDCIVIQTQARFEQRAAETADEKSRQTLAGRMLERALFTRGEVVRCDRQGRFLLPAQLIESLGIGTNVVIAGVNDRIEVWDAERWEQVIREAEEQLQKRAEQIYGGSKEA